MVRRIGALVLGVVIFFLLVFGIRGCLNARKKQHFRDYVRDVGALLQESDQQSKDLFDLLRNPSSQTQNPVDVTNNVNGLRVQAEQLVDRAKGTGHPGELDRAQRYLVEGLEFRRDGIAGIAGQVRTALGDQGRAQATERIAAEMQNFLASDVIYSQRSVPELQSRLETQGLLGEERVPRSQFLPDIDWLRPNTVADRIARIRGGASAQQPATPGLHGTALGTVSVKPGGQALTQGQAADIPVSANTSFDVQVSNQGENDESDVRVKVTISGAGKPIEVEQKVPTIARGETKTVNVPLAKTPPTGRPVKIAVEVVAVPGEKKTDNNKSAFAGVFTRP